MVAMSEIDSFFIKFKQLVYSGKNAHLDVKSEDGKAIVHLTVEAHVQHKHRAYLGMGLHINDAVRDELRLERLLKLQIMK